MSATRVGVTGDWPAFGIKSGTVTWGYFQSKEFAQESEKNELPDENGDIVALAFHGFKNPISFEARIKTTGYPGDTTGVAANGGWLALTHPSLGTLQVVMDSVRVVESNSEWVTVRGEATNYPSVATTTTSTTTTTTTT